MEYTAVNPVFHPRQGFSPVIISPYAVMTVPGITHIHLVPLQARVHVRRASFAAIISTAFPTVGSATMTTTARTTRMKGTVVSGAVFVPAVVLASVCGGEQRQAETPCMLRSESAGLTDGTTEIHLYSSLKTHRSDGG